MKFLIMGTGGVGGFFGGMLSAAGEDVTFVARGAHFQAMRDQGLRIRTTSKEWTVGPEHIKDNPSEAGIADAILFCVKAYDTESAARLLKPVVGPRTVI
ncbi:MAG TPA: 2-dehydropantoate 2-reductase, partial [Bacteroidota bacterium]